MDTDDFDEMNYLSAKVLLGTATSVELLQFKKLVDEWNTDFELNLINRDKAFPPYQ